MAVARQYVADKDIKKKLGIVDRINKNAVEDIFSDRLNKKLYVKDFGAKGDGIKNDSSAIKKAITVLRRSPRGTTLVFENDKTYYISSGEYAIDLKDLEQVAIQGNNCTILVKPIMSLCRIDNCKDLEINGINFDYKTRPYAVGELVNVFDDGLIRIKTDRSLNIRGTYNQPVPDYFGLIDRPDSRYHVGITSYKVINRNHLLYDVKCNNFFADRDKRIDMLKSDKYRFIVPMPLVGQVIENAICIENNRNILMKDCNVRCAAKYMFNIKYNCGFLYFENVNVEPDPKDEDMPIVGWRDAFYCENNRSAIIWDKCKVKCLCDDIIHISSTALKLKNINDDVFSLFWENKKTPLNEACVGDEIVFFNPGTGEFLGKSNIKTLEEYDDHIDVRLDQEIEGIQDYVDCEAEIRDLASPGSIVKNCDFHGTFRINSPLYVVKSKLHVTRMWINNKKEYNDSISNNILFSNCIINFDDNEDKYIHIDSNNINWKKAQNPYCSGNVIFYNCSVKKEAVQIGEIENEKSIVSFMKCYS